MVIVSVDRHETVLAGLLFAFGQETAPGLAASSVNTARDRRPKQRELNLYRRLQEAASPFSHMHQA